MNIVLIFICCMIIAFSCGFHAKEALDFGKMLIKNLRRVRLEIEMGNDGTTPHENKMPPSHSDERLKLPSKDVDIRSDSEQLR